MRNYFLSCLVFNDWIIFWNYFKTEVSNQIFVHKVIIQGIPESQIYSDCG